MNNADSHSGFYIIWFRMHPDLCGTSAGNEAGEAGPNKCEEAHTLMTKPACRTCAL